MIEKKINAEEIINGNVESREISFEDAVCEASFKAIRYCNIEYQQAIEQMYRDFISLKRINKVDMKRILNQYSDIQLGEDINPYLEDVEDNE